MNKRMQTYDWFARMLSYPADNTNFKIQHSEFGIHDFKISNNEQPTLNIKVNLEKYSTEVSSLSLTDLEELYTRTFDINPIASLEVGWHLYGEQYERGEFLVKMRQLLHKHFIEESSELPDHLTHILLLLGKMEKSEAGEFAQKYVLPSLEKILTGFNEAENPYKNLLLALKQFIEHEHLFNKSNFQQGIEIHE